MRRSRLGASPDMMTASSWKRCTASPSTTSPGGRCPQTSATGTASGSGSGGSAAPGCSRRSSSSSPRPARRRTWFRCSTARGARACLRRRRKRGQQNQALGRSRGGFSTKIHLKTDFDGLPIAFYLTEASDCTQLETSLDIGPDITPRAALTDKGYNSAANRAACRRRRIVPVIPYRANAKARPAFFPEMLYRARARIEQAVGKLKRFKRIALRCDKTADSYGAFVAFACGLVLVKSVHTA